MLRIVIECDAPLGQAVGVKEDLAQYLERFGDCRVVRVDEIQPKQMSITDAVTLDAKTGEWKVKK